MWDMPLEIFKHYLAVKIFMIHWLVLVVKLYNNHSSKEVCRDTLLEEVGLLLKHLSMRKGCLWTMVYLKLDQQEVLVLPPKSKMWLNKFRGELTLWELG